MNIAIIGYGKMGHEIERIARERGLSIKAIIDPKSEGATAKEISERSLKGVDVAIDFTHPSMVIGNVQSLARLKKNIVLGTTGWYDKTDEVRRIAEKNKVGLIWASNFSIGVNVFFRIIESASMMINNIPEYDIFCHEFHHNQKADSPSGTARSIANIILKNVERKKEMITETSREKIRPEHLHVTSTRAGSIPGTHIVGFDSAADTIELKHIARDRSGFALGAVMAAEWINGKKGFFSIDSMMKDLIR
ncbi:4-hydroxy-tetrahydrodipicolinate reductase [Candidatus Woesearchaeota archaeon CG10_big_fil_rev_8_21_14_0_10_44_13]|nr:MAG: 4-hydroxy-tetrahydrodipicolinate reductase [Candidatus Woesearchaeota archaeon CG10_big_fil_rev_8_21_14_0_10_44_13]